MTFSNILNLLKMIFSLKFIFFVLVKFNILNDHSLRFFNPEVQKCFCKCAKSNFLEVAQLLFDYCIVIQCVQKDQLLKEY